MSGTLGQPSRLARGGGRSERFPFCGGQGSYGHQNWHSIVHAHFHDAEEVRRDALPTQAGVRNFAFDFAFLTPRFLVLVVTQKPWVLKSIQSPYEQT